MTDGMEQSYQLLDSRAPGTGHLNVREHRSTPYRRMWENRFMQTMLVRLVPVCRDSYCRIIGARMHTLPIG